MNKTNSKEVKEAVRKYILENIYDGDEYPTLTERVAAYKEQLHVNYLGCSYNGKKLIPLTEVYHHTIFGCYGSFDYEMHKIREFIDSLNLNNKSGKKYSDDHYENLYINLITRESEFIFKHMSEKELNKML